MAYIYRLELHRRGPFNHPITREILDLYSDEWWEHIGSVEPENEVPSLLADNGHTHYTACFGCRSIDDLYNYMGEFILQVCASNGFSIYRYEVPDDEVYDGQYQSMFSRQYHKCGMNMGRLIIRGAA
jgi:hypothetical protein